MTEFVSRKKISDVELRYIEPIPTGNLTKQCFLMALSLNLIVRKA